MLGLELTIPQLSGCHSKNSLSVGRTHSRKRTW